MTRSAFLANAILWSAAIIASAIVGAPPVLSVVLLPSLAAVSFVVARPRAVARACGLGDVNRG